MRKRISVEDELRSIVLESSYKQGFIEGRKQGFVEGLEEALRIGREELFSPESFRLIEGRIRGLGRKEMSK